jgi:uncharacterized membrane protein YdbT with pleckstrin-like domain
MENQSVAPVMSLQDWIITLLISFIPLVGFIMLFVWAFGSGENPNKANWAKATLLWMVILFAIFGFLWFTLFAALMGAYQNGSFT